VVSADVSADVSALVAASSDDDVDEQPVITPRATTADAMAMLLRTHMQAS